MIYLIFCAIYEAQNADNTRILGYDLMTNMWNICNKRLTIVRRWL